MLKSIKFEESSQIDSLNNKLLLVYFDLTQFLAANAFGNLPSHHSYCLQPVYKGNDYIKVQKIRIIGLP